jgi:hypothetical protein
MLQGVLGLLTGWVLLGPAIVFLIVSLRLGYHPLMAPFLGVAASLPLLAFSTLGGIAVIALSLRRLSRPPDIEPPRA